MLKVTQEIYNKAVEVGYPEEFACVENISIPTNDYAEQIENWLLKEKGFLCRPFAHNQNSFSVEVRKLSKNSTLSIYTTGPKNNSFEFVRLKCIEQALNLIP